MQTEWNYLICKIEKHKMKSLSLGKSCSNVNLVTKFTDFTSLCNKTLPLDLHYALAVWILEIVCFSHRWVCLTAYDIYQYEVGRYEVRLLFHRTPSPSMRCNRRFYRHIKREDSGEETWENVNLYCEVLHRSPLMSIDSRGPKNYISSIWV